jgi:hypothetical protein
MQAFKLGITCLAERCRDLRDDGHRINTEIVKKNGKRFARYRIA